MESFYLARLITLLNWYTQIVKTFAMNLLTILADLEISKIEEDHLNTIIDQLYFFIKPAKMEISVTKTIY